MIFASEVKVKHSFEQIVQNIIMDTSQIFNKIKERLAEEITNSGMTLTEIASKMNLSISIIARYRNKKRMPSLENFALLCRVLDVSADYILGND
jgi:ribosome-binding protein aMBF1 (putative translation factor)